MRRLSTFLGGAIRHGVVPWVGWKDPTAVVPARNLYPHSPVPLVPARTHFWWPAAGPEYGAQDPTTSDFRNHEKLVFCVFEYVVGSLFPDIPEGL